MEDEMILNRPSNRRLVGEDNNLPPGPPGAESDTFDLVQKQEKTLNDKRRHRSPSSRNRRSPSRRNRCSPTRGRKSRSRNREIQNYGREYSPPLRRYPGNNRGRRSRDRIRSPDRTRLRSREQNNRRWDRRSPERFRNIRSRSRSTSPRLRRWNPRKKPASPPSPPPISTVNPYGMPQAYNEPYTTYPAQYAQQYPGPDYTAAPPSPAFAPPTYQLAPIWSMPLPADDYSNTNAWPPTPVGVPPLQQPSPVELDEEQMKRDAGVTKEIQNQRNQLKKQRNDYLKRAAALKCEMKILKEQKKHFTLAAPLSPTTKGFHEESAKLQILIQKKLNTIENGIIGEDKPPTPPSPSSHKKIKKKKNESDEDNSPERLKAKVIETLRSKRAGTSKKEPPQPVDKIEKKTIKEQPTTPKKLEETPKKNQLLLLRSRNALVSDL